MVRWGNEPKILWGRCSIYGLKSPRAVVCPSFEYNSLDPKKKKKLNDPVTLGSTQTRVNDHRLNGSISTTYL